MPFDANLVLCDGSTDWSYDNLVTYGTPTDTDRSGGFAVIDLLALSTTAAKGMTAVFICDQVADDPGDALTLVIEAADAVGFGAASGRETLCSFAVDGAVGSGIIDGDEVPCTIVRRFATRRRYIRAKASATNSDDFHTCYVFLAPWPFHTL